MSIHDPAWEAWFSIQYDVTRQVDAVLDEALKDRADPFKAATMAAVVEHLAERMRMYLELPQASESASSCCDHPRREHDEAGCQRCDCSLSDDDLGADRL